MFEADQGLSRAIEFNKRKKVFERMKTFPCRHCGEVLEHSFVNLGMSPFSNSYVPVEKGSEGEMSYPLHVYVCHECHLVQLAEFEAPEAIFSHEYAYFSSFSKSWLAHAEKYRDDMVARFGLGDEAHISEVRAK